VAWVLGDAVIVGPYSVPGFYTGDCRRLLEEIPEESVQCCVTSPPYWGLRVYAGEQAVVWGGDDDCDHDWDETERLSNQGGADPGRSAIVGATRAGVQRGMVTEATCSRCGAWRGGFGNEPTPELYVEHTIEIMEAIRRVLRPDGVLFLNIADSYISSNYGCYAAGGTDGGREIGTEGYVPAGYTPPTRRPHPQIPRKSLALIPARIALAAQAAGWVVRMDIIWAKGASFGPYHGNVMPESVQDRPTRAHEYVFMFTKSPQYYWDPDAVMEAAAGTAKPRGHGVNPKAEECDVRVRQNSSYSRAIRGTVEKRNLRSVWTLPTKPYKRAHFACFPRELPSTCIRAATPPKSCSSCGAPWRRVVERTPMVKRHGEKSGSYGVRTTDCLSGNMVEPARRQTKGWEPTCECGADTRPAIVLDPFCGSGTTCAVAEDLGRLWLGFDISEEYRDLQLERTAQVSMVAGLEAGTE